MNRKKIVYPLFFVVLASLGLIPSIPKAHAGSPSFFNHSGGTCANAGGTSCTVSLTIAANSEIIIVEGIPGAFSCTSSSDPSPFITDTFGDTFSLKACVHASNGAGPIDSVVFIIGSVSITSTSGTDTVTLKTTNNAGTGVDCDNGNPGGHGCGFDVIDYTAFTGFGPSQSFTSTASSGSNGLSITTLPGSAVVSGSIFQNTNTCQVSQTIGSQGTQSVLAKFNNTRINNTNCLVGFTSTNINTNGGAYTDNIGWTCSTCTSPALGQVALEVKGSAVSATSNGLVTQCFGNCGSPPITLVNTNSTHTVSFNSSLTIFYEFQSPLSGVINNITTNVAKSYFNGQQLLISLYTASCNTGITPFTATCPGQQQILRTFTNPVKGRLVIFPSNLNIQVNLWVGLAISASITGLDINDTNTSVNIFQQNPSVPPILASQQANGVSKMALWTWITGTAGGPPAIVLQPSCGGDLICILTNSVITLTPNNLLLGAIFMAFAYSIVTTIGLVWFCGKFSVSLPAGVLVIIWTGWFTFFPTLVGQLWFVVFEVLIVVLLFAAFSGSLMKGGIVSGRQSE